MAFMARQSLLMELVQIFESAARHYGTEKRVLLLHGPVGSAKTRLPGCSERSGGLLENGCRRAVQLAWINIPDQPRMTVHARRAAFQLLSRLNFAAHGLESIERRPPWKSMFRSKGNCAGLPAMCTGS